MKKTVFIFFITLFGFLSTCCFGKQYDPIKLAVFDNPQPDISHEEALGPLTDAYLAGIDTAIKIAGSEGIQIERKVFFHENNILKIMNKADALKTWEPNVIMGFHASNDFLMAKTFFGNQLLLSIAASDPKLAALPNNFYSLATPDQIEGEAIVNFINQHYAHTNVFVTVAEEKKETLDFATLFKKIYESKNPAQKVITQAFLTEDMNIINMKEFMHGYQPGDVIVIMSSGFSSGVSMMNKIADYLQPIRPVFVTSSDNWRDGSLSESVQNNYDSYRIDTLSDSQDSLEYKAFAKNYEAIYHESPQEAITYVTYRTVMSFVTALKRYPPPAGLNTTQAVLWSYQAALKHDPNWFRSTHFAVYKLEGKKEIYFETLDKSISAIPHVN